MHDCNRHRKHGYKDKTWVDRIPVDFVEEFARRREQDLDRQQNIVNNRFPSLAEARDQYLDGQVSRMEDDYGEGLVSASISNEVDATGRTFEPDDENALSKYVDSTLLTREQKANAYMKNNSPRNMAGRFVKSKVGPNLGAITLQPTEREKKRGASYSVNQSLVSSYGKQTLTGSIKTRAIVKNNFGMPYITNPKFIPVNKSSAKDQIFRTVNHDHEIEDFKVKDKYSQILNSNVMESPKSRTPNNFEKALADPLFASKLDKMSKNNLSKMMFSNDKVAA